MQLTYNAELFPSGKYPESFGRTLFWLLFLMGVGGLIWGVISLIAGLEILAVIPLGYVVGVLLLFWAWQSGSHFEVIRFFGSLLSLGLPFVFQALAGGHEATGLVSIWSLLALMGILTFHKSNEVFFWIILYFFSLTVSWIFEDDVRGFAPKVFQSDDVQSLLTLLNVGLCSLVLIILAQILFTRYDKKIREIESLNTKYEEILTQKEESIRRFMRTQKDFFDANDRVIAIKNQLEETKAELSANLNAIDSVLMVAYFDKDGFILQCNDLFCRTLGYDNESVIGKPIWTFFKRGDSSILNELQKDPLGEWIMVTSSMEKVWVQISCRPVEDSKSKNLLIAQNITSAKQIRHDYVSRYKAVENFNAVAEISLDGVILYANELYSNFLGYNPAELIGVRLDSLFHSMQLGDVNNLLRFVQINDYLYGEFQKLNKKGQAVWFYSSFNAVKNKKGEIYKIIELTKDISRRRQLEENLTTANRRISKINEINLLSAQDTEEQIQKLMEFVCVEVGMDAAAILIPKATGEFHTVAFSYGNESLQLPLQQKVKLDLGKNNSELKAGKMLYFAHRQHEGDQTDFQGIEPQSALYIGLESPTDHTTVFVLLSLQARKQEFSQLDMDFLFDVSCWLRQYLTTIEQQKELHILSLVASKTSNAVIITDKHGYIEWVNEGFTSITGYKLHEVIGKKPGSFLQGELTDPETVKQIRRGLNMQAPFYAEIINYHKFGVPYWINLQITPIFDKHGKLERFISIQADITERKNAEERIKQANLLLNEQTKLLEAKNLDLEAKNRQINDSLRYALRIQQAALGKREDVSEVLSDVMVFYRPKQIVSGDFYWFAKVGCNLIVAVVDCTGHGIPGAFMTMMTAAFLESIVNGRKITSPGLILSELSALVNKTLKQEESNNRDGMDAGICLFDSQNRMVKYAGANINLQYLLSDQNLEVIPADRRHIGGNLTPSSPNFKEHVLHLPDKTILYMFTDGFSDQFGGQPERKFTSKNVRKLLATTANQGFLRQHQILEETISQWIQDGNIKTQIDDILVLGCEF